MTPVYSAIVEIICTLFPLDCFCHLDVTYIFVVAFSIGFCTVTQVRMKLSTFVYCGDRGEDSISEYRLIVLMI